MALSNYGELKTAIADFLNRDDVDVTASGFITLAEAQIARDIKHWKQERRVTLSLDERFEEVPTDWLETLNMYLDDGTPVEYASVAEISRRKLLQSDTAGKPVIYTINAGQFEFYPAPDEAYNLTMIYRARIPTMAQDDDYSWLLQDYPDIYLYGSLLHTAPYLQEDQRVAVWAQLYAAAVKQANDESQAAKYSGSPLVMRNA